VKKQLAFLSFAAFAVISCGALLQAQQTDPSAAPPAQTQPAQTQPPETQAPPAERQPGQQTPDQSQSPAQDQMAPNSAGETQEFVGTVVKQGDKYVLQDAAGTSYDIDHQDEVKKFEGKKVRVNGTLDPSTKTIHVQ